MRKAISPSAPASFARSRSKSRGQSAEYGRSSTFIAPPLRFGVSLDHGDHVALGHRSAFGYAELAHGSVFRRGDRDLGLHRLEDHEGVTFVHVLTGGDTDLPHVRHHVGKDA